MGIFRIVLLLCLFWPALGAAQGVEVGQPSSLRNLVPAKEIEQESAKQYGQLLRQAATKGALAPDDHPQVIRLRAIARRLVVEAPRFNPAARDWRWEVNLVGSKQINAFCMPGGKIAVYTGLLLGLKLSDDEAAMVMGHEIAHALREHARERLAKTQLTRLGASLLGEFLGGGRFSDAFQIGGGLLTLKFSRDDETEADLVGLELAARAGYNPRAGISLWHKMNEANRSAPPQWLSTHPASRNRIAEIERQMPRVLPLYDEARRG